MTFRECHCLYLIELFRYLFDFFRLTTLTYILTV